MSESSSIMSINVRHMIIQLKRVVHRQKDFLINYYSFGVYVERNSDFFFLWLFLAGVEWKLDKERHERKCGLGIDGYRWYGLEGFSFLSLILWMIGDFVEGIFFLFCGFKRNVEKVIGGFFWGFEGWFGEIKTTKTLTF